jgi:hypothetical protein
MNWSRGFAALAACLALAACQRDAAPAAASATTSRAKASVAAPAESARQPMPATAAPAPAPVDASPAATGLGQFRIVSVLLGNSLAADKVVARDGDAFARGDTLHASVLSTGAHQGLRISARWLDPDGALIAETAQALVPTAATATTFTISNPQPWPPGDYQLLVSINGELAQTRKFKVR